jgi:hypothetical protein
LRRFAAKNFQAVEQHREISSPLGLGQIQRSFDQLCLMSGNWYEMDPIGDDDIAQLLRLKRYEQPPASYYEISCPSSVGGSATIASSTGVANLLRAHAGFRASA